MASSSSFIYFFLVIARDPQSALFCLLCMTWHSFRNVIPVSMNIFYSDSKTDLKLRCDSCIKIAAIQGCPRRTRLTAVCCMLLPHNPYRLPQHYKRHVCGSFCSCKCQVCGYLRFLSNSFV